MSIKYDKHRFNDKIFTMIDQSEGDFSDKLPANTYSVTDIGGMGRIIPRFEPLESMDNLVKFKTGIVRETVNKISEFLSPETKAKYAQLKAGHKLGILFHGKPGIGKTSTCKIIMDEMVEKYGAICLNCSTFKLNFINYIISKIRKTQDSPIIIFVDEFEDSLSYEETAWLTFLDGFDSHSNLIFIGSTNYMDKIPERIKNRKSRIKYAFEIKALPLSVYEEYINDRLPDEENNTRMEFSYRAEENALTIDQLKHALIDYVVEGITIEQACIEAAKEVVKI